MAARPPRDTAIDTMKGMLVIGMLLAHVIQLIGQDQSAAARAVAEAVNFVTYPGFLFCFGYACQRAYFREDQAAPPYRRLARAALNPLLAFYLSGLLARLFSEGGRLGWGQIAAVLALYDIPPYSEFLLGFSATLLLTTALRRPLARLLRSWSACGLAAALLLATTLLPPYAGGWPPLGLLYSNSRFVAFPALQYYPLFLFGMLCAARGVGYDRRVALGCLALLGLYLLGLAWRGLPARFPPDFTLIAGGLGAVYLYLLLARLVARARLSQRLLLPIGANVLVYVLLSNTVLFAWHKLLAGARFDLAGCALITAALLAGIFFCTTLVRAAPSAASGEGRRGATPPKKEQ